MTIKAIETRYAGCRFRSRLEARWAVFFDTLGIQWEYEPEGFETAAGPYLPDFCIELPAGQTLWFEVKPDGAPSDPRHRALVEESGIPLVVARGLPRSYRDQQRESYCGKDSGSPLYALWPEQGEAFAAFVGAEWGLDLGPDLVYELHYNAEEMWDHLNKDRRWVQEAPETVHLALYAPHVWTPCDSRDVDAAYTAARSARFEHGESGARP